MCFETHWYFWPSYSEEMPMEEHQIGWIAAIIIREIAGWLAEHSGSAAAWEAGSGVTGSWGEARRIGY
jgi:hypothetical protein